MILVSRDSEGLYLAAVQMLENSLAEPDRERRLNTIAPDDLEQMRKLGPRSDLSPGYEDRVFYLLWMHDRMNAGIQFENVTADEADGIAAVLRARTEFNAEHPPCPGCGQRLSFSGQRRCFNCQKDLR